MLTTTIIIFYLLSSLLQWRNFKQPSKALSAAVISSGILAVLLQGYWLHLQIDQLHGQNLAIENILSMVIWLAALLTLLTLIRLPVLNLILFIFPLAIFSVLVILIAPGHYLVNTDQHPREIIHILLAIITFSFMFIAALQAIFLMLQERILRHKQTGILQLLPPLQTMEAFLFQTLWIGFLLLSILLVSALCFFHEIFSQGLMFKSVVSIIAWCLYASLLLGRLFAGWRGKVAIRVSLLGFLCLLLTYF